VPLVAFTFILVNVLMVVMCAWLHAAVVVVMITVALTAPLIAA
jgi:hypothetical protein